MYEIMLDFLKRNKQETLEVAKVFHNPDAGLFCCFPAQKYFLG